MKNKIDEFINYLSVERGLANNTLLAYRRDLTKYAEFSEKKGVDDAQRVNRGHITDYMFSQKQKGLCASSISRNLAAIKTLGSFAHITPRA